VPRWLSARLLLTLIFCGCAGLLAFALYLQHALDLEPCPMCILQRYGFLAAGVLAGLGAVHGPGAVGQRIYAALVGVAALAGGGVAARHNWVEHHPPRIADCGTDHEFKVDSFPLSEALPMIFRGSGDCSKVAWRWLGLSIAEWSLVAFSGILLTAVLIVLIARAPRRR
jgi:disulfide bond formation protein DsbB